MESKSIFNRSDKLLKLELKIPPVLLVVIFVALMWGASYFSPGLPLPLHFRVLAFACCGVLGLFIAMAGVISFSLARTTVNPMTPDASSALVVSGIYKHTRNPMYLGFLLALTGWGLFLSNLFSLVLLGGYVMYMNYFQITPEERSLESIFGQEFVDYKKRVRRWL
jgi:protein-S-isoprenylcysteine O-methyltransferase Ste14